MEFLLDSVDIREAKLVASWGVLRGVTLNPLALHQHGLPTEEAVSVFAEFVDGPIFAATNKLDAVGIVAEAEVLRQVSEKVVLNVPLTAEGLRAIHEISQRGGKAAATLVYTVPQALLAAQAGCAYICPFLGRNEDISEDGASLMREMVGIYRNYALPTKVLATSLRHPLHVLQAARAGAHGAVCSLDVMDAMIRHPLTDLEIERDLMEWSTLHKPSVDQGWTRVGIEVADEAHSPNEE
ncbi:transaldolase family protein [Alicyclobacillus sp. SP_1]|uniref:transaldolase family protein n=1 Tax=Alicyclobacillus sp. SP_1 TaxID=2942475 RepID=UPI0021583517|nr:transaldolase family protein [Alicyclobacillus sp. SP_1]